MANVVVTSDAQKIKVVFNDLSASAGRDVSYFQKSDIVEVYSDATDSYVTIVLGHNENFNVSIDGTFGTLIIDSVDAVAPSSNADLRDKIAAFII